MKRRVEAEISHTNTRAQNTLSLSLSLLLTLIKVQTDKIVATVTLCYHTTTVYPSRSPFFFERCTGYAVVALCVVVSDRPLFLSISLRPSSKFVPYLVPLNDDDDANDDAKTLQQAKPANAAMLQLIVGFLVGAVFVAFQRELIQPFMLGVFGRSFFHREKRVFFSSYQ